jgi:hypothetical protein
MYGGASTVTLRPKLNKHGAATRHSHGQHHTGQTNARSNRSSNQHQLCVNRTPLLLLLRGRRLPSERRPWQAAGPQHSTWHVTQVTSWCHHIRT